MSDKYKYITDNYIDNLKDTIISETVRLIGFDSVTGNAKQISESLNYVLKKASDLGMKTGITTTGDVGFAEIGGEGGSYAKTLGILVHVDVVGIGDKAKWNYPPFGGQLDKGILWGRGAVDDKGPVIMCLYAMKAVMDSGIKLKNRIRLIIGTSEETVWTDMDHYKEEFGCPDFGFSPDGDFPVYNIEKGYADTELIFNEPRLKDIIVLTAGDAVNTVPGKAVMQLSNELEKIYTGVAIHSSTPQLGDNAILRLAKDNGNKGFCFAEFLNDLYDNDPCGSKIGIDDGSDLHNGVFVGKTVAAPTILQLTENGIFININIRCKYGTDKSHIEEAFRKYSKKYSYKVDCVDFIDAMMVDSNLTHIRLMNAVYEKYGYRGECKVADGASYAKSMNNFVCWGPVFPGEPSCAHMEDEGIAVDKLIEGAKIYAAYIFLCANL
ncbi:MAG: M20/M25/M40 family metallo-hydrolase [Anaerovoracaceae bacterium]